MGKNDEEVESLEGLIKKIRSGCDGEDPVPMQKVLQAAGRQSFGPMLLVPGLIGFSPLSGIPGVPTFVGIMVLLVAGQLLMGRSEFWVPQFVLRRSVSRARFDKAMPVLTKVAGFVDRFVKPRLTFFAKGPAMYIIASICVLLSLTAPFLELLPFAISGVGAAITAFGLSLVVEDGVLALIAVAFCIIVIAAAAAAF